MPKLSLEHGTRAETSPLGLIVAKKTKQGNMAKGNRGEPRTLRQTTRKAEKAKAAPSSGLSGVGVAERNDKEGLKTPVIAFLTIFVTATAALVGPYGQKYGYSPDLHMAAYLEVGILAVLTLFAASLMGKRELRIIRTPVLIPLVVFYLWAMLSVLWAHSKYEAVHDALEWTAAIVAFVLVILSLRSERGMRWLYIGVFITGLLIALLGIAQYLFAVDWVQQHIVPGATFSNKNMAGQYGSLTLPFAMYFFLQSRSRITTTLLAVAVALFMTYMFYTRARGTWVAFVVETGVFFLLMAYLRYKHNYHPLRLPYKRWAAIAILPLFLGFAYLTPSMFVGADAVMQSSLGSKDPALASETGLEVLNRTSGSFAGSANTRTTMWGNSWLMLKDHFWTGVGLGNWTVFYATYQSSWRQDLLLMRNLFHQNAHNDFVEIICELGVIGFAFFLWFLFALFKTVRASLLAPFRNITPMLIAPIVAIAGISTNAAFSFPFKQPVPIFFVLVYVGAFAVLHFLIAPQSDTRSEYRIRLKTSMASGTAALVLAGVTSYLTITHYQWYQAEVHYRKAAIAMSARKLRTVANEIDEAIRLNPLRSQMTWFKATSLLHNGKTKEAIPIFEKLVDNYPYSSSNSVNLISAYVSGGQTDKALALYDQMVKVQPTNGDFHKRKASLLSSKGRVKEMIESLELASAGYLTHNKVAKHMQVENELGNIRLQLAKIRRAKK